MRPGIFSRINKPLRHLLAASFLWIAAFGPGVTLQPGASALAQDSAARIDEALAGWHRSAASQARDKYRHPKETLLFFGLRPDMTVVEISPANGWYTEIIAPVVRDHGQFYGASPKLGNDAPEAMKKREAAYPALLAARPAVYGDAKAINFDSAAPVFAPAASVDLIVTFRNVHNWAKAGNAEAMFKGFYAALKPGGILGVVEHRAKPGTSMQQQINSGYMSEATVTELARQAGFTLAAQSEINANPLDTADHPGGVWNLPPNLRGVADADKPKYIAIGESDRMTLKFVKP